MTTWHDDETETFLFHPTHQFISTSTLIYLLTQKILRHVLHTIKKVYVDFVWLPLPVVDLQKKIVSKPVVQWIAESREQNQCVLHLLFVELGNWDVLPLIWLVTLIVVHCSSSWSSAFYLCCELWRIYICA